MIQNWGKRRVCVSAIEFQNSSVGRKRHGKKTVCLLSLSLSLAKCSLGGHFRHLPLPFFLFEIGGREEEEEVLSSKGRKGVGPAGRRNKFTKRERRFL